MTISPRKLRVLTLIDRPITTGGGERMASTLAMALDPARFDRWLCSSRSAPAETFEDELRAGGVEVLVLDRASKVSVAAWGPLFSLLRRERIDVLHAHKFGSNLWGTIVGRLARVPVIVAHEHSWSYEGDPLRRFLDREVVARGADAFVAVSREDERRMISVERIPPDVIRFIPNGIPPLTFRGTDIRGEQGIEPDAPVVVWVGQMRPEKSLDVLVQGAALAARQIPGLCVLLAGHGPEEEAVRRRVAETGLTDVVRLLGRRSDVPDVLAAADVAVLTSEHEGSPLSVLEYMAAGLPVVSTAVGGVPDLVEDGIHGRLVPPHDAGAVAAALVELLSEPQRRAQMGRRAKERQRAEFSFEALVRRVEALYEELFAETARARSEARPT